MKYLCYKKEEFKLKDKDQNLMKNIENKRLNHYFCKQNVFPKTIVIKQKNENPFFCAVAAMGQIHHRA